MVTMATVRSCMPQMQRQAVYVTYVSKIDFLQPGQDQITVGIQVIQRAFQRKVRIRVRKGMDPRNIMTIPFICPASSLILLALFSFLSR